MHRAPAAIARWIVWRRIGVHRDIGVPVGGGLDPCPQLGLAECRHVERRARRRHASPSDELDLRSALQQLLAHAQANLVRAVGDHRAARFLHRAQRSARTPRDILQRTQVAVAAGGGDHRAARINARPRHDPFVDRLFERERGTAEVANRGEAAHQRALGLGARGQKDIAHIRGEQARYRQRGEHGMPVRIDQARHDDPAAAIDRARALGRRRAPASDRLDPAALDQQAKPFAERARLAVEQQEIREHDWRRRLRQGLRFRFARQAERSERGAGAGDESAARKAGVDPARQCLNFRPMAQAPRGAAVIDRFRRGAGEHGGELQAGGAYRRDGPPVKTDARWLFNEGSADNLGKRHAPLIALGSGRQKE